MKISGFSLIEVLVALLIFSIGLLGIAMLQLSAIKATDQAYLYSIANIQVASMLERLQANAVGANQEFETWNQQNKDLLPQAKGEFTCNSAKHCTAGLQWNDGETHYLSLKF